MSRDLIRVLRDGELIVIEERDMIKTDIFFEKTNKEDKMQQDLNKISRALDEELDNMTKDELKEIYKEKVGKNPFNGWSREKLIKKIQDLKLMK